MRIFETKEITEKKKWENFLLSRNPGTFLQSWNWGETNKAIGYKIKRLGFYEKGKLSAVALLIHQPAKRGPHYLIPGGPVLDYKDKVLLKYVFSQIKDFARKSSVWFVRIRPDIEDNYETESTFRDLNLNPSPMHVHGENTLLLDISRNEEEILKGMRKNTRYLIKKSLKEGYNVEITKDVKKIDNLYKLQLETVKRHKFVGFKKSLFSKELETFGKDNQALLFECKKGNLLLASALVIFYANKAFYHFSGSSMDSVKTNASYFLQWQIIKKTKELGYKIYDFWGIAANDNPRHRFWGVTVFKKGFGGKRVNWVHAHDMPIRSYYWITYFFETVRKGLRRLY